MDRFAPEEHSEADADAGHMSFTDNLVEYQSSPAKIFLIFSVAVLTAEIIVMVVMDRIPMPSVVEKVISGLFLLVLLLPVFYYFLFRPLVHHIEESKRVRDDLRLSAARLQTILNSAFDGIVVIDEQGVIRSFNHAAERIFGMSARAALGQSVNVLMPQQFHGNHNENLSSYLGVDKTQIIGVGRELTGQRSTGETFPMDLAVTEMSLRDEKSFVGIIRDITARKQAEQALKKLNEELDQRVEQRTAELEAVNARLEAEIAERKKIEEKLQQQAITDRLTGIFNRRHFDRSLEIELERARRYQLPFSLIMFDIDHFKRINDEFGHIAGDSVLVALTILITSEIRFNDIFARWGGEEFALLVPGTDLEAAKQLAEKLRATIAEHRVPHVGQLTVSFGVVEYHPGESSMDILRRADKSLYRAKENGRNRVEIG